MFPPNTVCAVDGCTSPPTGVRPSTRDIVMESTDGTTRVLAAGTVDEAVCSRHLDVCQIPGCTATELSDMPGIGLMCRPHFSEALRKGSLR